MTKPINLSRTQQTMVVAEKRVVAEGVVALTLRHPSGERLNPWAPGAHIDVMLPGGITRQYSLRGDRWNTHEYQIGVLREPTSRGGSEYVHSGLEIGDVIGVGGPRNNFQLVPARGYIFIAGGIGITPILPMLVQAEMQNVPWTLHYGGRSRSTMGFLPELEQYGDKVVLYPNDEVGDPNLPEILQNPQEGVFVYSCGPGGLLNALAAFSKNWPEHAVRTERFVAAELAAPSRTTAFEVELAQSGEVITVAPDSSILIALRAAGADVMSSCQTGTCGTCEVGVIEGVPEHRDSVFDAHERALCDRVLVCVSRSLSDRLVLDI